MSTFRPWSHVHSTPWIWCAFGVKGSIGVTAFGSARFDRGGEPLGDFTILGSLFSPCPFLGRQWCCCGTSLLGTLLCSPLSNIALSVARLRSPCPLCVVHCTPQERLPTLRCQFHASGAFVHLASRIRCAGGVAGWTGVPANGSARSTGWLGEPLGGTSVLGPLVLPWSFFDRH